MQDPVSFAAVLSTAETELDRLADELDVPVDGMAAHCILVLGIARQAFVVYEGLRREARADPLGVIGPMLLRSLAEGAILVRRIEDSPSLRVDMYGAEDDRSRLASAEPFQKFRARRGTAHGPVFPSSDVTAMKANIADVRARASAASEPIGARGPLLPSTEKMALQTGDTAMWEAYEIIYRISGPWAHLEGHSLSHHRLEARPDGAHVVVDGGLKGLELRAMAAPLMAHLVGSTSRICGLGIEAAARVWQDAIITWPTPMRG